ncbi:MAG: disulfide bond formation protein B [Rhodospirillales bacterium]|nr:disulfide bond formation protein B [Rhodospirillales bacterium]
MNEFAERLYPYTAAFILAVCAVALGSAYTAQYWFDLEPCELCLYQRVPYAIAGFLSIVAMQMKVMRTRSLLLSLCAVAFVVEAGLAFHHVGVEQHWWQAFTSCSGDIKTGLSLEELKTALLAKKPKACDEITWQILGLSITVYNVVLGLAMAAFSFAGARWTAKKVTYA